MIDNNDPKITAYILGELNPTEVSEIEKQIEESTDLRNAVDELRQTIGLLESGFQSETMPALPSDAKKEIEAAADSKVSPKKNGDLGKPIRWGRVAMAASVLVAIGGLVWIVSAPLRSQNDVSVASGSRIAGEQFAQSAESQSITRSSSDIRRGKKDIGTMTREEAMALIALPRAGGKDGQNTGDFGESGLFDPNGRNAVPGRLQAGQDFPAEQGKSGQIILDSIRTDSRLADGWGGGKRNRGEREPEFLSGGEVPILVDSLALQNGKSENRKSPATIDLKGLPLSMTPAAGDEGKNVLGPVTVETIDDDGMLILRGTPEDVAKVREVIDEIAKNAPGDEAMPALTFPDPEEWAEKVERRRKYAEVRLREDQLSQSQREVMKVLLEAKNEEQPLPNGLSDKQKSIVNAIRKKNAEGKKAEALAKSKSWKRVKAIPNTSRLMVGDRDELDMQGMQVNVQIDGFRARVLIDCFYYNDRAKQLEGSFKLRLPDDASLYYFAFGESSFNYERPQKGSEFTMDDGEFLGGEGIRLISFNPDEIKSARKNAWDKVKEARIVPREKAAFAYGQTVRRRVDPALVEWAGAGVFNAKVYPLMPHKLHRVVIGYDVNLVKDGDKWTYDLALPEQTGRCEVDLSVTHPDDMPVEIFPKNQSVRGDGISRYRYDNPIAPIQVKIPAGENVMLFGGDEETGEYFATQFTPDLPKETSAGSPKAIFLVDTSLSSQPDKFNVWLQMLAATLTENRDSLNQFAVVFFDVEARWWQEKYVENSAENVKQLLADCEQMALEGATDLYAAVRLAATATWTNSDQKQKPDLFLLSDGAATWGETNLRLIDGLIADSQLGNVFAYQTGLSGTAVRSLRFLAGNNGGAVFSITTEDEIKAASTAHRNRPWKLAGLEAAGGTDILTAGRVQWVYPGQAISVVGRGIPTGEIKLALQQGDETKEISIQPKRKIDSELASRMYGQVAVGQLESLGTQLEDFSAAYARQFRITGQTCSLLMLESEADYQRFNIKPEDDLFVVRSKQASQLIEKRLKQLSSELADPKAQLTSWLEKLETAQGLEFKIPMPLKLAIEDMALDVVSSQLRCKSHTKKDVGEKYLQLISAERLDYDRIIGFAQQREQDFSASDAIKVLSNLVERNPGDLMIARDVAFSAIEWEKPDQAYPLLKRVAMARPYEGHVYLALGHCLQQMEQVDLAMVFYEIAVTANFAARHRDFNRIAKVEYFNMLCEIDEGVLMTSVPDYAKARFDSLSKTAKIKEADIVVTMIWNTDRTDVDLHVTEPSGETCSYNHKSTKSGGGITVDITDGYGPEMYVLPKAPAGSYEIKVNYFGSDANRTSLRSKVYLTIYEGYGTTEQNVTRKTVRLDSIKSLETVATVIVE